MVTGLEVKNLRKKTALIGMSGGVDSSVAAFLIQQEGFSCTGCTMRLHDRSCGGSDDVADARAVAEKLGIDHMVLEFQREFAEKVMDPFVSCYERGLTPNPCIRCNRSLKFGAMLDRALALGFEYIVSGHYARIRYDEASGRYLLYKAADKAKDQTYFLACLSQQQLSHIRFPLGELAKEEVRAIAERQGFGNARKKDSQDICFVPGGDYVAFMEQYTGKTYPSGQYLDLSGKAVGIHRGAVCYTIGQRKGLGIALGAPVYVCAKDMKKNTVTVGPNEALFSSALRAEDMTWFPFPALEKPIRVTVKTRHSQHEQAATVYPGENNSIRVEFDAPQRAVTPGQAVVLYQDDLVIGGGTIKEAYNI